MIDAGTTIDSRVERERAKTTASIVPSSIAAPGLHTQEESEKKGESPRAAERKQSLRRSLRRHSSSKRYSIGRERLSLQQISAMSSSKRPTSSGVANLSPEVRGSFDSDSSDSTLGDSLSRGSDSDSSTSP